MKNTILNLKHTKYIQITQKVWHTLREDIFAGINYRNFFSRNFSGIDFRDLDFIKDFAGRHFRGFSTKTLGELHFAVSLRRDKINMVLVLWFFKMRARVREIFFSANFLLVDKHRFIIERHGMWKIWQGMWKIWD